MRSFELPEELEELTDYKQWVVYTYDQDGGLDKTPKQPNGVNASSTSPKTWSSFSDCVDKYAENDDIAGLGFVLTANDPYTVIDLDHCVEDGIVDDVADSIARSFGSFSETSPSETGLHIWIRGVLGKGRKRGDIECYDRKRYITVTGSPYKGGMIEERQAELAKFVAQQFGDDDATDGSLFSGPSKKVDFSGFMAKRNGNGRNIKRRVLEDAEILDRCRKADDGERFIAVFDRGDYGAADFPSGSEADAYLISTFCFWTAGNFERSWNLLRQSGLRNDPKRLKKWARGDYRDRTWELVEDGLHHCEVESVDQIRNGSPEIPAQLNSPSEGLAGADYNENGPDDRIDALDECVYRDASGKQVYVLKVDKEGNRSYIDFDGQPVPDDDRILYRMDEVSGAVLERRTIAIFPDEVNADAFVGHAINFTPTTVPGIWTDEMAGALKGCEKVLLFMGRELAEVLAAELNEVGVPCYWPGDAWSETPAEKFEELQEKHRHEDAVAKVETAVQMAIRLEPAPELPPLDEEVNLNDFPLEVFPQPVRRFVRELSEELKWDTGPVGAAVLGIAASAVCDKYIVRISETWEHALTLWPWILAPSGSKKTALIKHLAEPLDTVIKAELKDYESKHNAWQNEYDAAEAEWNAAKKKVGKEGDHKDYIRDKAEELRFVRDQEPVDPDYRGEDVTPESAFGDLLRRKDEHGISKLCFVSSEADAILNAFTGHYFKGKTNNTLFLKGRDLDRYTKSRMKGTNTIEHVCISMVLAVQSDLLIRALQENRGLEDQGLVARIEGVIPRQAGRGHVIDFNSKKWKHKAGYSLAMQRLARLPRKPPLMRDEAAMPFLPIELTEGAREELAEFYNQMQDLLDDKPQIASWISKLAGKVAGIAGILHLLHGCDETTPIRREDFGEAVKVGWFLLEHMNVLYAKVYGGTVEVRRMRAAVDSIIQNRRDAVCVRDLHRGLCNNSLFPDVETMKQTLETLAELGYVTVAPKPIRKGPGRPPSPEYNVHPAVLEPGFSYMKPRQMLQDEGLNESPPATDDDVAGLAIRPDDKPADLSSFLNPMAEVDRLMDEIFVHQEYSIDTD